MAVFLDTRGRTKIAIAICGRCGEKFPYDDLMEDPNIPGLRVCRDDRDDFDPYRLPSRESENISLEFPRPDIPITGEAPTALFGMNVLAPVVNGVVIATVSALNPMRTWQPNTFYRKGDTVTPFDVDADTTTLPQVWLVCLVDGFSSDTPPVWPKQTGVYVTQEGGFATVDRSTQNGSIRISQNGNTRVISDG
jgi:hypothetical protein